MFSLDTERTFAEKTTHVLKIIKITKIIITLKALITITAVHPFNSFQALILLYKPTF